MFHAFVGSVRYAWDSDFSDFPFEKLETRCADGTSNLFVMGVSVEFDTSAKIVEFLRSRVGELLSFDVSISSEDRLWVFSDKIPKGAYSCVAYHGRTFADVEKSLRGKEGVVAVREAEESKTLWGRVIKADVVI